MVMFITVSVFAIVHIVSCGKTNVGINLEGISYYSAGVKFLNRFNGASTWRDGSHENFTLDLDANGYVKSLKPGQSVGAYFMDIHSDDNIWHLPESVFGDHVFLFEGDCFACRFRYGCVVLNNSVSGRWIVDISPKYNNSNCYLGITNMTSDYPRNMSLVPIEYEKTYQDIIFEPTWTQPINETGFYSVRFMDLLSTNNNPIVSWSERTTPANFTQGNGRGMAWEYVIHLVNSLNISAWINIPAMADDNYIEQLAIMWKNDYKYWGVNKLYIEYSNECWNGQFQCHSYMEEMGNKSNQSSYSYYGQRVCDIRKTFDKVLDASGNQDTDDLIYVVMGAQDANYWVAIQELPNHSQCVNGVAIAAYYCMYNLTQQQQLAMSNEQLFENIMSAQTQDYHETSWTDNEIVARSYQGHDGQALNIVAYEGSWGCTPPYGQYRQNLTDKYNSMCVDSGISDTVTLNLQNWEKTVTQDINNKFSLINVFSYIGFGGQYGNWGHLQFQDSYTNKSSTGRYKWDGLMTYINQNVTI